MPESKRSGGLFAAPVRSAAAISASPLLAELEFLQQRTAADLADLEAVARLLLHLRLGLLLPIHVLVPALISLGPTREALRDDDQVEIWLALPGVRVAKDHVAFDPAFGLGELLVGSPFGG